MKVTVKKLSIDGTYKVPFGNPFTATAILMPQGLNDNARDDVRAYYDDVFHVFESGDPIVGDHGTHIIYSYDVLEEMEVPAIC